MTLGLFAVQGLMRRRHAAAAFAACLAIDDSPQARIVAATRQEVLHP
jgi:hypothetical protein